MEKFTASFIFGAVLLVVLTEKVGVASANGNKKINDRNPRKINLLRM